MAGKSAPIRACERLSCLWSDPFSDPEGWRSLGLVALVLPWPGNCGARWCDQPRWHIRTLLALPAGRLGTGLRALPYLTRPAPSRPAAPGPGAGRGLSAASASSSWPGHCELNHQHQGGPFPCSAIKADWLDGLVAGFTGAWGEEGNQSALGGI